MGTRPGIPAIKFSGGAERGRQQKRGREKGVWVKSKESGIGGDDFSRTDIDMRMSDVQEELERQSSRSSKYTTISGERIDHELFRGWTRYAHLSRSDGECCKER